MTGPKMWPSVLPAQTRADRYRAAEVKIYDHLHRELSAGWTVFYSRPWLGLTPTGGERDGECDFVIAHPDWGVLVIEVKGGGISYDAETDKWRSRDRDGIRHNISNPIEQARKGKHELLRKLRAQPTWPISRFVRFRHGVIFPDVQGPPSQLGADRPRELFCCRDDLPEIGTWIKQRLSGGDEEGPGAGGMRALERLLAAPFMLRVPLAQVLEEDDQAIASLTPQQFYILDAIMDLPRAAVGGAAGTGKTIVAVEDAVRQADEGRKTLLTCRGLPLAEHLRTRLAGTAVQVQTFHELCLSLAQSAGLPLPATMSEAFYDTGAPELLLQAVEYDPELKFGAIIVDEAQDFRSHWWIALDAALADQSESRFHAFYDTNQKLYGAIGNQLANFAMAPIRLSRNLRNTQAIHETASKHYKGPAITADGPAGVSIEVLPVPIDGVAEAVINTLKRLVQHEAVKPCDIAVLAADPTLVDGLKEQSTRVQREGITCETIINFKGLERPVVIVVATRALADEAELAYVALSRARTHLVLVGEPVILDWLSNPSASKRELT